MNFLRLLVSTKVSLVLLLILAGSMAVATFAENEYGSAVARFWVYEAWWFELILLWLAVNFLAHIPQYRLFRREKWPVGLFHAAFCLILLGAGITRYFSKEGQMHIRTGQTVDKFYSTGKYLQLRSDQQKSEVPLHIIAQGFSPKIVKMTLDGKTFDITLAEYITGARENFVDGKETFLSLAVARAGQREDVLAPSGTEVSLGDISLGIETDRQPNVRIFRESDKWMIESDRPLHILDMNTMQMGLLDAGTASPLLTGVLYESEASTFSVKAIFENVELEYVSEPDPVLAEKLPDVIKITVKDGQGAHLTRAYLQPSRFEPAWHTFSCHGQNFAISFGSKAMQLPFALHLDTFELERYPGSLSPASYASQVRVMDNETTFPYRIFMNNVLDYKGFRFYQSSYDADERGTILAVNQDRPGTYLTYLGYILLSIGMFLTLFVPGSRFWQLNKELNSLQSKTIVLLVLLFAFVHESHANGISLSESAQVPAEKAAAYGQLIVQDLDGRMKPLNTLAGEIVRKLTGKQHVELQIGETRLCLSPEQFLLAVQLAPDQWKQVPLIKVNMGKAVPLFALLGKKPQPTLAFQDYFSPTGDYLLTSAAETANQLKPAERDESLKELIKADERFNIFYALLNGDFLRIFPNRKDEKNTWFTREQHAHGKFDEEDAIFVKNITDIYLTGLKNGITTGDWTDADKALGFMDLYQKKAGAKVYPSESRIRAELLYNRLNLGSRLFGLFWVLGTVMLAMSIVRLIFPEKNFRLMWLACLGISWLGWLGFTFHLGLRWYVAGHAPWSDGFEMLVFSAWGILLSGLLFSAKNRFAAPLGLLFTGTLLFVSFLDWLNPEITNLMPVLHSYWLKVHVAVVVSGYAPLALGATLGLCSLVLLSLKHPYADERWWKNIRELTIVNEMTLSIGLFVFTVGTFLGGVWANESWGRYWAWDPKETWALISIMVYAFVLHLRLVPALRNPLMLNLASLWAFPSIIMTSFGVNYYLAGLHSYAKGDPVPVPDWVYVVSILLACISLLAILRYRNLSNEVKNLLEGQHSR